MAKSDEIRKMFAVSTPEDLFWLADAAALGARRLWRRTRRQLVESKVISPPGDPMLEQRHTLATRVQMLARGIMNEIQTHGPEAIWEELTSGVTLEGQESAEQSGPQ